MAFAVRFLQLKFCSLQDAGFRRRMFFMLDDNSGNMRRRFVTKPDFTISDSFKTHEKTTNSFHFFTESIFARLERFFDRRSIQMTTIPHHKFVTIKALCMRIFSLQIANR